MNWEIVAGNYGTLYQGIKKDVDLSLCTAKIKVWQEPEAVSSLTGDAASAQNDVIVADVSGFEVGEPVRIEDDTPQYEHNEIASIDVPTKTLSMVTALSKTFTVTQKAKVLMRFLIFEKACSAVEYSEANEESYVYYDVAIGDFPLTAAVEGKRTEYDAQIEFTKDGYKENDLGFKWIVHPAPPSEAT